MMLDYHPGKTLIINLSNEQLKGGYPSKEGGGEYIL